ncbi:thiamine biosynthesis lipoprotein [Luteibacter rhizovicinus]|uniref:FAD:protein FMN transferase n=2 Tax=Luteibacter rhizovicinus TaxID=242606 RepID=A0A4V2W470_9GAMM|nr:thiamine biosynthesis lipoprotein [Luteibacter rhizovicinus]
MGEARAHQAIDEAFSAIERVHALMSFHEAGSDLSRLHAAVPGERVILDVQTVDVLREALTLSGRTDGAFDVTVAAQLVAGGLLPAPTSGSLPADGACWKDIDMDDDRSVSLRRPLWIDLGGIAKGYAVDRAVDVLCSHGVGHACVNAGGDLRTLGEGPHRVAIATDETQPSHYPVIELGEASMATSSGRAFSTAATGPHIDGRHRSTMGLNQSVTVIAEQCMHADALTKVVMAMETQSADLLRHYNAVAYLQDAAGHWTQLGVST